MEDQTEEPTELQVLVGESFRFGRYYALGIIYGRELPAFSKDNLIPVAKGLLAELDEITPFILAKTIHNLHQWIDEVGGVEAAAVLAAHGGERFLSPTQRDLIADILK